MQIYDKTFHVSSTERWIKGAGIDDMFQYQKQKALMEIANDVEHGFIRGSRASGNASTARRMAGALNYITTSVSAVASGTTMDESHFNGIGEDIYNKGGRPDEVYVGARLKRIISSYTAGATKNIASEDKRLVNAVDVYELVKWLIQNLAICWNTIKVQITDEVKILWNLVISRKDFTLLVG